MFSVEETPLSKFSVLTLSYISVCIKSVIFICLLFRFSIYTGIFTKKLQLQVTVKFFPKLMWLHFFFLCNLHWMPFCSSNFSRNRIPMGIAAVKWVDNNQRSLLLVSNVSKFIHYKRVAQWFKTAFFIYQLSVFDILLNELEIHCTSVLPLLRETLT